MKASEGTLLMKEFPKYTRYDSVLLLFLRSLLVAIRFLASAALFFSLRRLYFVGLLSVPYSFYSLLANILPNHSALYILRPYIVNSSSAVHITYYLARFFPGFPCLFP